MLDRAAAIVLSPVDLRDPGALSRIDQLLGARLPECVDRVLEQCASATLEIVDARDVPTEFRDGEPFSIGREPGPVESSGLDRQRRDLPRTIDPDQPLERPVRATSAIR